jgi:RimJ/RimL family protein N-acetyltransferase
VKTGSWLGRDFQGRALGKEMRAVVLALAFDGLGAEVAETEAFVDNAASAGVSRSLGYEPNGIGRLAPLGEPRETLRFRMTREMWRSCERPPVTIEGLEGCLELFGVVAG